MYVRIVLFMCDGRQLLDEINVVLSSLILRCIERGSVTTSILASKSWRLNFGLSMSDWGHVAA